MIPSEAEETTFQNRYLVTFLPDSNKLLRYEVETNSADVFELVHLPFKNHVESMSNYVFLNENDVLFAGEITKFYEDFGTDFVYVFNFETI
jgi:hypothetical protein